MERAGSAPAEAKTEAKARGKSDNAKLQTIGGYPTVDHPILSLAKREYRISLKDNYFPNTEQKINWALAAFESAKQLLPREWESCQFTFSRHVQH
jgi:hypothetical protein